MKIKLGETYKDTITDFSGIATARAEYLNENTQVRLEAQTGNGDAKSSWFAEGRLEPAPAAIGTGFK